MKILIRYFACLFLATLLFGACGQKEPEKPAAETPTPAAQPVQPAPATPEAPAKQEAATTPAPAAPAAKPAAPAPAETKPAAAQPAAAAPPSAPAPPEKLAVNKLTPAETPAPAQTKAMPGVVILKAPLGGVRFDHKAHAVTRKIACATCHHPSRPEKPATAPQEACSTCHTSVAKPPMKTKLQAAFHNPTATAGTCIDCHKAEIAKGKKPPVKCLDCHKKENK